MIKMGESMNRHFCASVFVVDPKSKKILLVFHGKFHKWVQPGGHIEDNETPEEAAMREVYEETGLRIKLLGRRFPREDDFIRPLGIQCNRNLKGDMHIDITYAAVPYDDREVVLNKDESLGIGWFTREQLDALDVFPDIKISFDYILEHYIK